MGQKVPYIGRGRDPGLGLGLLPGLGLGLLPPPTDVVAGPDVFDAMSYTACSDAS